ncbi:MAG: hypothetical protein IJ711_11640 [Lachnospiraceae bacterium]|nr:hypothetical protein [Lachnospiraceae bacterium]
MKRRGLCLILIIVALVLICVCGIFYYHQNSENVTKSAINKELTDFEKDIINGSYDISIESHYDEIKASDNAENFEGEWKSIETQGSHEGELTISNQTQEGFQFSGVFYNVSDSNTNTGDADGFAYFINEHTAICKNNDDVEGFEGIEGYAVFYLHEDTLYIRTTGTVGLMGGGVVMDGKYSQAAY